jgi:hypothetical protein
MIRVDCYGRKIMKAHVQILQPQPLIARTKGNKVSEEETNTPKKQYTVNAISAVGEPIEPPEIVAKFCNAIGAIIRTKVVLDLTIPSSLVLVGKKEAMWQLLSRTFVLLRGTREKVKHYAMKMLGETFCRWKSELNTRYVKKGQTPFEDFGDIT